MRDGFVFVLRLGVVLAHQALQFGKFADHFGEQIGLAQLRGAFGLGDVGADQGCQLTGERDDARDAFFLRAELFVKDDLREFRQPRFERRLQVGLVEELGVAQARADDALIASDDRLAAVAGLDIGDENELVDELRRLRIAQHETFLVGADGRADHLAGNGEEGLVELAHQHDRPFDQAGDLGQEALVLDQLIALRESRVLGVGADDVHAPRGVEHDLGGFKLGDVIVEAAHLNFAGAEEAMAARDVAACDAIDIERHHDRLLGLGAESRDDRMQGPHPGQRAGFRRLRAPAHRLRPREAAHDFRNHHGQQIERGLAFLLGDGDVEVALLVGLHRRLIDRRQTGGAQKTGDRLFGRADLGAFAFFLEIGRARRHALHGQRKTARRGESLGAFVSEPGRDQPVGDHFLQVIGGARLHARRDLFGKEFKQKIGHQGIFLWLPSHSGALAERLQVQKNALPVAPGMYSDGVKAVPLCEPSQNGCVLERPQAHHQ